MDERRGAQGPSTPGGGEGRIVARGGRVVVPCGLVSVSHPCSHNSPPTFMQATLVKRSQTQGKDIRGGHETCWEEGLSGRKKR